MFFYVFSVLCLLCLCTRLFICALWPPAGTVLTSKLSIVVSINLGTMNIIQNKDTHIKTKCIEKVCKLREYQRTSPVAGTGFSLIAFVFYVPVNSYGLIETVG